MKSKVWIGIVAVLLMLGVGSLYVNDAATMEQAGVVQAYLQDYCRLHNEYPDYANLESRFPELYPDQEWYYWPNESLTVATFQYPMTLPIPSAPGRSKVSEFLPVIYAYAVQHPCKGIIQQASREK